MQTVAKRLSISIKMKYITKWLLMATKDIYGEKMANLSTRHIIINMYARNRISKYMKKDMK